MKILVTGGAGHLGSHVCDALVSEGHDVTSMDYGPCPNKEVRSCGVIPPVMTAFRDPYDVIYHLAGEASVGLCREHPLQAHSAGSGLILRVLEAARQQQKHGHLLKAIVFVSSAASGNDPYAIEKWAGEEYCRYYRRAFGLPVRVIRLHNVYGSPRHKPESGNVIPSFLQQKRVDGRIRIIGSGQQKRDFVHYTDAVRAIIAAAVARPFLTEIGSCQSRSISEVAELFDCPIDYERKDGGPEHDQFCRQSDYPTTVDFEETVRALARDASPCPA